MCYGRARPPLGARPIRTFAVIPAHNEAETVADVIRRAVAHVDRVIVVDDGSTDATAALAQEAGAEVISLNPNRGKGAALRIGLQAAVDRGAEVVVTLDADGEHDPDDLPRFRQAIEHADVVLGARHTFRSGARRALNGFALFWFQLIDPTIQDTICGYRAFRTSVLPKLAAENEGFAYEHEVILLALSQGLRMTTIEIATVPRERSHVSRSEIVRVGNHFSRWVLQHSATLPMPPARKALLLAGCAAGLAVGTPVAALLRRQR